MIERKSHTDDKPALSGHAGVQATIADHTAGVAAAVTLAVVPADPSDSDVGI